MKVNILKEPLSKCEGEHLEGTLGMQHFAFQQEYSYWEISPVKLYTYVVIII